MRVRTRYKSNAEGTGQIVATLGNRQKTVTYDHARSNAANHGLAAGAVIIHTQRTAPELQYGDNIVSNVIRSLDAGYGSHDSSEDGTVHVFEV